jgi:hypothetical protein
MQGLAPPQTIKVYQLLKMSAKSGLYISPCGVSSLGIGMFMTLQEAEHTRTLEILRDTDSDYNSYHVFELDFPNPAYKE